MVKTLSNMLPLGTKAPNFSLLDVITNKIITLNAAVNCKGIVVMFICNHCPYVRHINKQLVTLCAEYIKKNIAFFAINSNDIVNYPDDSPENMYKTAKLEHYPFPYLFDETQEVAKSYQAACTPDFYLFDQDHLLMYRGQFDDSRPGSNVLVTGKDLQYALNCLLANRKIDLPQKASLGCNIKWKI